MKSPWMLIVVATSLVLASCGNSDELSPDGGAGERGGTAGRDGPRLRVGTWSETGGGSCRIHSRDVGAIVSGCGANGGVAVPIVVGTDGGFSVTGTQRVPCGGADGGPMTLTGTVESDTMNLTVATDRESRTYRLTYRGVPRVQDEGNPAPAVGNPHPGEPGRC